MWNLSADKKTIINDCDNNVVYLNCNMMLFSYYFSRVMGLKEDQSLDTNKEIESSDLREIAHEILTYVDSMPQTTQKGIFKYSSLLSNIYK